MDAHRIFVDEHYRPALVWPPQCIRADNLAAFQVTDVRLSDIKLMGLIDWLRPLLRHETGGIKNWHSPTSLSVGVGFMQHHLAVAGTFPSLHELVGSVHSQINMLSFRQG